MGSLGLLDSTLGDQRGEIKPLFCWKLLILDVIRGRHEYKSVFNFVFRSSWPKPRGAFKHDLWIALHKLTHYLVGVVGLCLRNFIVAHEKLNH